MGGSKNKGVIEQQIQIAATDATTTRSNNEYLEIPGYPRNTWYLSCLLSYAIGTVQLVRLDASKRSRYRRNRSFFCRQKKLKKTGQIAKDEDEDENIDKAKSKAKAELWKRLINYKIPRY